MCSESIVLAALSRSDEPLVAKFDEWPSSAQEMARGHFGSSKN
jgi:hypothetical protein